MTLVDHRVIVLICDWSILSQLLLKLNQNVTELCNHHGTQVILTVFKLEDFTIKSSIIHSDSTEVFINYLSKDQILTHQNKTDVHFK